MDPLQALLIPFKSKLNNIHTYTIFTEDKKIVGIFGVMPKLNNSQNGRIWFITSDLIESEYHSFLRGNKRWLHYLEEHYNYISNYISCENNMSIHWLKWQGFTFAKQPMLVKDVKVLYFYKRLHNVTKYGTQPILDECGPLWRTEII